VDLKRDVEQKRPFYVKLELQGINQGEGNADHANSTNSLPALFM
jgi:hypothetical protein